VLGVKDTLSEMARPTIRARLTAGLLHQAERGDLALSLPLGLGRESCGKVHKTPDREVQQCSALLCATCLRVHTASTVLPCFTAQHLTIPGRDRFGDLAWQAPTISASTSVRQNPA
jgi:hypothetical protein